jgi:hypothetical protein
LITWARKGPPAARVDKIVVAESSENTGIKAGRVDILPTI